MSDPIAVSILSKLTSYWSCDGNLTDAHGPNDISSGLSGVSYEAGQSGLRLVANARGYSTLAVPIPVDGSTEITIGGRFVYGGLSSDTTIISVGDGFAGHNEVLSIDVSAAASKWYAGSWANTGSSYLAESAAVPAKYPLTIRARDASGTWAYSQQEIDIATPDGITAGLAYDVYGVWQGEYLLVYVNGELAGTSTPPRPLPNKSNALCFQIGNQFSSNNNPCSSEELLLCAGAALSADEIQWLYNRGMGRAYADIVAAA